VLTTLLSAFILGLFAGMAPGPYTTMVVGTALEKDFPSAAKLAFAPVFTDLPPLIVTAFLLERLSWTALTVVGVAGGVLVCFVGLRFLLRHGSAAEAEAPKRAGQSARMEYVVLSTLFSPAPWLFWLVIGSPLMLAAWDRAPIQAWIFAILLFATNISTATGLAWAASHGRRVLGPRWQRRALRAVGGVLIGAGLLLVWQSLAGNFQEMVDRQDALRGMVEEGTSM
jgi:threonine/homoserine/homoserine lactone efflux protein